jgi:hypothetical protein
VSLHPFRPETKGQAEACPDRTRAIPGKVQVVTAEVFMIRNMHGMISATGERTD